jgi:hypothetical protein
LLHISLGCLKHTPFTKLFSRTCTAALLLLLLLLLQLAPLLPTSTSTPPTCYTRHHVSQP